MTEFNEAKACFYLLVGVFGVYAFAALFTTGMCYFDLGLKECVAVANGKIGEAFNTLLVAASTFVAGRLSAVQKKVT